MEEVEKMGQNRKCSLYFSFGEKIFFVDVKRKKPANIRRERWKNRGKMENILCPCDLGGKRSFWKKGRRGKKY